MLLLECTDVFLWSLWLEVTKLQSPSFPSVFNTLLLFCSDRIHFFKRLSLLHEPSFPLTMHVKGKSCHIRPIFTANCQTNPHYEQWWPWFVLRLKTTWNHVKTEANTYQTDHHMRLVTHKLKSWQEFAWKSENKRAAIFL